MDNKHLQIGFRVSEEEKKEFMEIARSLDLSLSQLIRRALKEYIENLKVSE